MKKIFSISIFVFFSFFVFSQEINLSDENLSNTDLTETISSEEKILSLSEIDVLIKDTNYDKALVELNKFIAAYPKSFDSAQMRVRKIMKARNSYSNLADNLFEVILNDPDNNDKIFNLTQQLKILERHPSDIRLKFFKDIEVAAEFNYYRVQFNKVQEESSKLANEQKFVDSVVKSRSGFYMYKDDFDEEFKNTKTLEEVNQHIKSIDLQIEQYKLIQEKIKLAKDAYVLAVKNKNFTEITNSQKRVESAFTEFANIRNSIANSGLFFEQAFAKIQKQNPDITDASFLPFIMRFVFGQKDYKYSGIIGGMDYQFDTYISQMKNETTALLDFYCSNYSNEYKKNNFKNEKLLPTEDNLKNAIFVCDSSVVINNLYSLLNNDAKLAIPFYSAYPEFANILGNLTNVCKTSIDLIQKGKTFCEYANDFDVVKLPENPHRVVVAENVYPEKLKELVNKAEKLNSVKIAEIAQNSKIKNEKLQFIKKAEKTFNSLNEEITLTITDFIATLWKSSANYYSLCADGFVNEYTAEKELATKLLNGTVNSETQRLEKFPQEAYDKSESKSSVQKNIKVAKNVLTKSLKNLDSKYKDNYSKEIKNIQNSITILDSLSSELLAISSSAREKIILATKAKNEGDLRYSQATKALKAEDFETARKRLQEALTKYNESLSFQESKDFRNESDKKIAALGQEILQKENEIVVRDVRKLKLNARKEYYSGNFEVAYNLLTQAKARWAVTNVEEDNEIISFMAIVERARKMTTGRKLQKSDPLHTEMSQILSIANQYYNQGERLISKGKKAEGLSYLEEALKKIAELRIVYPQNEAAAHLTLKIQKLQNPEEFNKQFPRRVEVAKNEYNKPDKKFDAYNELSILYEMNPTFPGLEKMLYNMKIDLGLVPKPVDRTNINKSVKLTKDATNVFNRAGKDEFALKEALKLVNQALEIYPENEEAMILKDRIQISIGGKAVVVLSSEDEYKYQEAVQKMNINDTTGAIAIVNELLKKPQNKRSSKILDLMKQLEVRTGVKFSE